ncbi:hypothetical protein MSAN_02476600 [Mycena sanguinolenta]|uniref:Uncharacterized protein n=1 Tax=Mycena sanguinolenta TaxID=230812 RepID=A0A8H6U4D2_9AGAR|nr:hypothetical protein MSAN_02476600 [Mycena sanguinolenta]
MNIKNDVLRRKENAIQASVAYAKEKNVDRGHLDSYRNALFVGFIIPHTECHRWADAMFPDGPHSRDTCAYDPIIPLYLNDKFGKVTDDPNVLPFHVVANSTGPLNVMYVVEVFWGHWNNPLAMYDIDEVFEEKLLITMDEQAVRRACQFLREELDIHNVGAPKTYYSVVL